MGRPRNNKNKDLPPGLEPPSGAGCYRMPHPLTGKRMSLKTKDKKQAIDRYWKIKARYEDEVAAMLADKALYGTGLSLSEIAKTYRETLLPHALNNRGKKLDDGTEKIYRNYLKNLEADDIGHRPVTLFSHPEQGPQVVREYLSQWLGQPKTYNNRKSCLSKLFDHCIDKGLIQRNPCQVIKNKLTTADETYIPDEHYLLITDKLAEVYGEVYARVCDWLYLVSGRPTNMLNVIDKDIDEAIYYYATKNDQPVIVELDAELKTLVEWFREEKRSQNTISRFLIVHPRSAGSKLRGKNITTEQLYRRFKDAARRVELGHYTLRHIRPKALTDEAMLAGEATNKGAHKTQAMRERYVKKQIPVRVQNNLKRLRE